MPYQQVNGARLFYDEQGAGAPVIFHHGYNGSHDSWEKVMPRLADRWHCIVMDARGAGDSEHTAGGCTIEQYAADVVGMADALGLDRFTYVGHSMGGLIGMELGISHAERLEKLVLVAPAPSDGMRVTAGYRARQERMFHARDREGLLRERLLTTARRDDEAAIARAVDRSLSVSEAHFQQSYQSLVASARSELLGKVTTPTLLVAGAADGLLPANLADFARMPNATLHVFSRVSHGIPREAPAAFARVLADFLEHGVVTAATLQADLRAALKE